MTKLYPFTKCIFVLMALLFVANSISAQTIWNGSVWSNGNPNVTLDVSFTGDYISPGSLSAKSVAVSNNAQVTIASGHTLSVTDNITVVSGSALRFENNASLLQTSSSAVNTGDITFKRNSTPMRQYDYTYWTSPVSNQTLYNLSPLTNSDRYFSFDASPATNNWVYENSGNNMQPGKGYAIMAPSNYNATPQSFNASFTGTPNNGNYTVGMKAYDIGILNYNFIGNPYPSAISVASVLSSNTLPVPTLGALYFWTHNTAITNNVFTSSDYAIRTLTSGTVAESGGTLPGDYIAAGQGFFASSNVDGNFTFTNAMRVADNNSQFFKNAALSPSTILQYYYIWLNMTNTGGAFKQLSFGYQEGATDGYDFGTDAPAAAGTYISFYSLIGTNKFAVQGRAFPWTIYDQIPLGYATTIVGPFDITLDHNHVFFDTQAIFLEDMDLGVFHNLKTGPYTFNTVIGTFNSRFKIHYFNSSLFNNEFVSDPNSVVVSSKNKTILVDSIVENIKTIQIYDISGKMIFEKNNINEKQCAISNLTATNQSLIIKTDLENNQTIVKKLVY